MSQSPWQDRRDAYEGWFICALWRRWWVIVLAFVLGWMLWNQK